MSTPTVRLTTFAAESSALLSRWLREPHVSPWYPDADDHVSWALDPPEGGERAMISADDRNVGYVRWQVVSREVLDSVGLMDVPSNSVDVDILIGESDSVARGVGPAALKLLVARLISAGPVPLIALTTSVNNKVAHRAFFKAGFRTMRGYSPPGYGECDLMVFTPAELPR